MCAFMEESVRKQQGSCLSASFGLQSHAVVPALRQALSLFSSRPYSKARFFGIQNGDAIIKIVCAGF
jgi:hypothetical protein